MSVLNGLAKSYGERDIDRVMALFAPDADVVWYGSGPDEKRIGTAEIRAQIERDWAQSDAASITYGHTSISSAGPVAWVAADLTFNVKVAGQEFDIDGRLTNVLEKREGEWLMVQGHFSVPSTAQDEGESFPS